MDITFEIISNDQIINTVEAKGITEIRDEEGNLLVPLDTLVGEAARAVASDVNERYDIYEDDYYIHFVLGPGNEYNFNIRDIDLT